jgi:hypothetical protein
MFKKKKQQETKDILQESHSIIYKREDEPNRGYGPMKEGMERAAKIASASTGKDITAKDMYLCLVALKLSRESYNKKYDNLLDAIGYLAGLYEHYKEDYNQTK